MGNDEITSFLEPVRSMLCLTLTHLKAGTNDISIKKGFDSLVNKTNLAETEGHIALIRKEYRSLILKMDSETKPESDAPPEKQKRSLLSGLFGKAEKESKKDLLSTTVEKLLATFAKGTLLILKDKSPLYKTTSKIKTGDYENYSAAQLDEYGQKLVSFFMNQSWESEVVSKERSELKKIIAILAENIEEFGKDSESFDTGLSGYAKKIEIASSLDDIIKAKKEILFETEKIRESNKTVNTKLKKAKERVDNSNMRINELEEELKKVNQEKLIDHLTQVHNRGALDSRMKNVIEQVKQGKKACYIMFDVDNFKKFNDSYGHRAGDLVLKTVSTLSKEIFADGGFVARYGGEEFSIIVFEKKIPQCSELANRLLKNISSHEFIYKKKAIHITVSMGLTMIDKKDTLESAYKRADDFLYEAKRKGKNRVIGK